MPYENALVDIDDTVVCGLADYHVGIGYDRLKAPAVAADPVDGNTVRHLRVAVIENDLAGEKPPDRLGS